MTGWYHQIGVGQFTFLTSKIKIIIGSTLIKLAFN